LGLIRQDTRRFELTVLSCGFLEKVLHGTCWKRWFEFTLLERKRFYAAATGVFIAHDAIIDKLIGDEVMALFIPGICGPEYHRRAVDASRALMRTVGYGSVQGPWMPVGAAVHSGLTYVGNVGEAVVDFTALGDTVNTAARLAQNAAGEVLLSDAIYTTIEASYPALETRTLSLRGKEAALTVHVLSGRY
jgi:adenylate cyclase